MNYTESYQQFLANHQNQTNQSIKDPDKLIDSYKEILDKAIEGYKIRYAAAVLISELNSESTDSLTYENIASQAEDIWQSHRQSSDIENFKLFIEEPSMSDRQIPWIEDNINMVLSYLETANGTVLVEQPPFKITLQYANPNPDNYYLRFETVFDSFNSGNGYIIVNAMDPNLIDLVSSQTVETIQIEPVQTQENSGLENLEAVNTFLEQLPELAKQTPEISKIIEYVQSLHEEVKKQLSLTNLVPEVDHLDVAKIFSLNYNQEDEKFWQNYNPEVTQSTASQQITEGNTVQSDSQWINEVIQERLNEPSSFNWWQENYEKLKNMAQSTWEKLQTQQVEKEYAKIIYANFKNYLAKNAKTEQYLGDTDYSISYDPQTKVYSLSNAEEREIFSFKKELSGFKIVYSDLNNNPELEEKLAFLVSQPSLNFKDQQFPDALTPTNELVKKISERENLKTCISQLEKLTQSLIYLKQQDPNLVLPDLLSGYELMIVNKNGLNEITFSKDNETIFKVQEDGKNAIQNFDPQTLIEHKKTLKK